jgi:hypothetical protein
VLEPDSGGADCLVGALSAELWDAHLGRWLPRFAQDLQAQTELALYRRLGEKQAELRPQAPERPDDA